MNDVVTLITGTRKGIGKYLAHHLVSNGHFVIGCSRNEPDWKLEGYNHICADVTNEMQVTEVFRWIKKTYGKLDNLINNAGIASMNHSLLTPMKTVETVFGTNVYGTFLFCREAAKVMRRNNYGRIVNFTTVATPLKLEGEAVYAASKAAVITLTHILAREFSEFGITVNAVGPTPIDTDLIRNVPQDKISDLLRRQAIRRIGTFEDVANVIDFYLRRESDFVTGQALFLGGV